MLTGGLTFVVGIFLPILLYPESNLAPIIGIFGAPPAAILGGILGWTIARFSRITPRLAFVGCAMVPQLFFALQTLRHASMLEGRDVIFFAAAALIFGVSGAWVAVKARRAR
jgi:hypothetical protein